jgi:hypothetical protein
MHDSRVSHLSAPSVGVPIPPRACPRLPEPARTLLLLLCSLSAIQKDEATNSHCACKMAAEDSQTAWREKSHRQRRSRFEIGSDFCLSRTMRDLMRRL